MWSEKKLFKPLSFQCGDSGDLFVIICNIQSHAISKHTCLIEICDMCPISTFGLLAAISFYLRIEMKKELLHKESTLHISGMSVIKWISVFVVISLR